MRDIKVRFTGDDSDLRKAAGRVEDQLRRTGAAGKAFGSTMNTAGRATGSTTNTLQEFSRIIQDAPYGIQGVGNNITQLVTNFGTLSQATGGAGSAIRALVAGLAGPAGLILAVSLGVSLLTTLSGRFKSGADDADKFDKALEKVKDSIKAVNQESDADLRINKLQIETLKLQGLEYTDILQTRRKILGTQLQNLQNLIKEEEKTLALKQTEADRLSFYEGINKAADGLIMKTAALSLALGGIAADELLGDYKKLFDFLGGGITIDQSGVKATREETDAISESEAKIKALEEERLRILKEIAATTKEINDERKNAVKAVKSTVTWDPLDAIFKVDESQLTSRAKLLSSFVTKSIESIGNAARMETNRQLEAQLDPLLQFQEKAASIIEGGLENTLGGIGDAIGRALAEGGNVANAVGASLLQSIGNIASQLGQTAIAIGIGIESIKTALKSLNGPVAVAAGVALVALGAFFKASSRKLASGFGGGGSGGIGGQGSISGTSAGSIGSRPGTTGVSAEGASYVVFEIQGTKLIGVLENTLKRNRRAGSGSITIAG